MTKTFSYISLFFLLITTPNLINSTSVEVGLSKTEPIQNSDLCDNLPYRYAPEVFYFVPVLRAKLFKVGEKYSFSSRCFLQNIVTLKEISVDTITLVLENKNKTETFCSELFIFHTSNKNFFQFVAFAGEHEIVIKRVSKDDKDEIKANGIKLLGFCNGLLTSLKSLYNTIKLFYGGLGSDPNAKNPRFRPNIPKDQEKANLRLMDLYVHFTPERRQDTVVNIDKNDIHTGDFLVISRFDGLDNVIMMGSGGHAGHSAVCAWMDGELYVLESQSGWYWPKENIQKTKWEDWIVYAHNADFNVAILPLREEYRNKLDVTKANEWYYKVEGLPYGYHNFLFGWIDTVNDNFPFGIGNYIVELIFSIVSKVYSPFSDLIITEALNIRLNTKGLTFQQAIAEGARQGKSFEQIIAEPEVDGIEYHDGLSYVCSSFVVGYWKNGGMFGDMVINPSELTSRDVYQMDIFDKNYQKPQVCIDDNPDLPYCQLMGKFVFTLDGYSTITPYSNMYETCPSVGPYFIREVGC